MLKMTQETKHTPLDMLKNLINVDEDGDFFYCKEADPLGLIDKALVTQNELLEATQGLLLWLADETIKRRLDGIPDSGPVEHALKAIAKAKGQPC